MTATRRRYTKRQKVEAVAAAGMTSTEAASESLGIPRRTLGYWTTLPEFAELRQKTREDVADMFWAAVQIGVDQVAIGLLDPEAALRDKATALGIIYDKHALLTGNPTARTENVSITDGLDDHEKAALREAILGELARRADERAAVPAVGHPGESGATPAAG